jgi:hypothetical protein
LGLKDGKNSSRRLKNLVTIIPLVLLFVAVALDQSYGWTNVLPAGTGANAHPSSTPALQMIGYSYESGPALLDVTLANVGTQPITLLNVTYDNQTLAVGQVGGSMPMFAMAPGQSMPPNTCNLATDVIIFPHFGQWNMDTGGPCSATIAPGGPASLYLGISNDNQTQHFVLIHTQEGDYILTVPIAASYISPDNNATLTPGA